MSKPILQPFVKTYMPESEVRNSIDGVMEKWRAGDQEVRAALAASSEVAARARLQAMYKQDDGFYEVYLNDMYQVAVYDRENPKTNVIHMSIKRCDRQTIHDWRHLQEIKNLLIGPNHEAIELYPAEDRRVDAANQYHLWVWKDPNFRFPIGFPTRCVKDTDETVPGAVQRKL